MEIMEKRGIHEKVVFNDYGVLDGHHVVSRLFTRLEHVAEHVGTKHRNKRRVDFAAAGPAARGKEGTNEIFNLHENA